jgi:hypothetical protein
MIIITQKRSLRRPYLMNIETYLNVALCSTNYSIPNFGSTKMKEIKEEKKKEEVQIVPMACIYSHESQEA